jgi:NAD(P)-dependent dehydrogenase (short-subunit alcohol dehydrogenase family)
VVDAAFTELGQIDVVVSNADYGVVGAAEELDDTDIDRLIATNRTGSIQLARAVVPLLRAQGGVGIRTTLVEPGMIRASFYSAQRDVAHSTDAHDFQAPVS